MGNVVRPDEVANPRFVSRAELSRAAELHPAVDEHRWTPATLLAGRSLRPSPDKISWRNRIQGHRSALAKLAEPFAQKGELVLAGIVVLIGLRCVLAATLPLSFDEAYYWLWSKHLAPGYFDHPAAIAIAIRTGTSVFGDTEFGVRFVPLAISVVATWAVWRTAAIMLGEGTVGAVAALLFNCTLMIAAESLAATPDVLLIAAAAITFWSMAKLEQTQDGRWWLAAGAAVGLGVAAKYTGFFLCVSIALWLVSCAVGKARGCANWLWTPWPYIGAGIVLVIFAPTLYWNATHGFISFRLQFGRIAAGHLGLQYLLEFFGSQLILASPGVLILAAIGSFPGVVDTSPCRRLTPLLSLSVWPPLAYFLLHSLHDRVQGNWPCFVYPGVAILAAAAFAGMPAGCTRAGRLVRTSAIPISCVILGIAYMQACFGFIHLGRMDPIARMMAVGFRPVAEKIAADAKSVDARAIVTTNYPVTSWLRFYQPSRLPIIQIGDDSRFLSSPVATRGALSGNLLYVTQHAGRELPIVLAHFSRANHLEKLIRSRDSTPIDAFDTFEIGSYRGAVIGRTP